MAYAQILQRLLQRFFVTMGRAPLTPNEWSKLRRQAMELARKEEGIPSVTKNTTLQDLMTGPHMSDGPKGQRIWDFSKDLPTRDVLEKSADIIPFPRALKGRNMKAMSQGIEGLMQKGDVQLGKAPKTTPEHLKAKKDRGILLRDADEDIARIKKDNKSAIERFKEKFLKKDNVEDVYFDHPEDPRLHKPKKDPDKFYAGGIAPLVGEPSYAADFYDDRTPMAGGSIVKGGRWFLNNLRKALKDIESNQGFKNLSSERKEGLTSEIKNLIKSVEGGGPIPDEMIQTIRHDPKFAEISKTRSTDPDLYEFEDLILNYGKKGDVVDEQVQILEKFDPTNRLPNQSGGPVDQEALIQMYLAEGLSYEEAVQAAQSATNLPWDTLKKAEGGIIRAGFPFGGQALKAIRGAWRANKDWGVGGPPYKPEKTSFDIKEMTKRTLGKELSLTDLRRLSESPLAGPQKGHFEDFNKQFKNIKAQILREKMMERKLEAKAMIHASDKTMKEAIEEGGNLDMAEKITGQMKRESKEALAEAKEGLKAIDIYMGMLQKKGKKLHAEGGRVSYSGGGRAGLPAITYGTPQMNMQGPQMPAGPQPAGIPGANLQMNQMDLMQQKMQQNSLDAESRNATTV